MTTIIEIITQSLRKANVIPQTATPSASQAATALGDLNRMMALWEEGDIFLQYYTQTDTADTFPCAEYTEMGVIGSLAIAVCPNYGRAVSAELLAYTEAGMEVIRRKAQNKKMRPVDMSHLPAGSGWRNRSNILDG